MKMLLLVLIAVVSNGCAIAQLKAWPQQQAYSAVMEGMILGWQDFNNCVVESDGHGGIYDSCGQIAPVRPNKQQSN